VNPGRHARATGGEGVVGAVPGRGCQPAGDPPRVPAGRVVRAPRAEPAGAPGCATADPEPRCRDVPDFDSPHHARSAERTTSSGPMWTARGTLPPVPRSHVLLPATLAALLRVPDLDGAACRGLGPTRRDRRRPCEPP
jgi:hypothetical protein